MKETRLVVGMFLLLVGGTTVVTRGEVASTSSVPVPAVSGPAASPPQPVWEDGQARLGSVRVDPDSRTVIATGWVNQVAGPIELLACGPGGKTHESVLVLGVSPLDLQAGILLLGIKPGTPPTGLGQGRPSGPGVELWVDWRQDGTNRSARAEQFIYDLENKAALPEIRWIFTGSVVEGGQFKALAEESLVATYWDPWSIINIPLPCGSNDEVLVVNEKAVPKLGTPVTFRIKAK